MALDDHAPDPWDDHHCPWRDECEAMRPRLAEVEGKLAAITTAMEAMERRYLGPKSEKMPPPENELRRKEPKGDAEQRRLAGLERRRQRAAQREKLREQTVTHHVSDEEKECPSCGGTADRPVGDGKQTTVYEYVPGTFVRQKHVQEKLACRCGDYIATAEPPRKVVEGGRYGAGFIAHLIVMKCADSIPLHRLAKQYQRLGIPMSRSTLTDLFHAAATKAAPLSQRLLELVASADIVQADETSMLMQRPHKRGFVWTFLAGDLIGYRFSADRSGETPQQVLGGTRGTLVVDAYTGYNRVTDVEGRERASCLAHVRRKFFEALPAPEARRALDLILDVYRVEHEAKAQGIVRTPAHLALRQTKGRKAMDALREWLLAEENRHAPKTPLAA